VAQWSRSKPKLIHVHFYLRSLTVDTSYGGKRHLLSSLRLM
jgi:hypothetical protein